MKILKSSEDYLEAMLIMKEVHGYIRSIDIAMELGVTKPSVSYATKRLRENGYITMDKDGFITLTDKGMDIAAHIYERHKVLTSVLIQLGVNPETAREDACKLEHDISDESFDALKRHLEKNNEQK
ncbi:MAG: metal-dependent transcriptional regulator [Clostridiales bacterium]|nr:metal-dependent transcriptional regulator [Clostridiales bacterium]MDY2873002.1 metal-dependent transcriptional regulator [Eubacteriales bacterium]